MENLHDFFFIPKKITIPSLPMKKVASTQKTAPMLDPIIPVEIPVSLQDEMLQVLRRIRSEFGIRNFLVIHPADGVRMGGYPNDKVFVQFGNRLAAMQKSLSDTDIRLGWWCAPTLTSGVHAPHIQHIVGANGKTSKVGICPLDPTFADDFVRRLAIVAKIAHPFMIQFEDDFELSNHVDSGSDACYCPLHLKAFEQETGKKMTRQEICAMFKHRTPENLALRQAFTKVCRESLVNLATKMRTALNEVSPETRMCECEPGPTDIDGYLSNSVCPALAGDNTRPIIRLFGTLYCSSRDPLSLMACTGHLLYSAEHLPAHFEKIHESDTFPHNRFFMSASNLRALLYSVMSMGLTNSLIYAIPYLDKPLDDTGYLQMYKDNAKRLEALIQARQNCSLTGLYFPYTPEYASMTRTFQMMPEQTFAARLGFSYTTLPQKTAVLAGQIAEFLSDQELLDILSKGVLIDADAADILQKRGFGKYLGVKINPARQMRVYRQRILPRFASAEAGNDVYFFYAHVLLGDGKWRAARKMVLEGAESVVDYIDHNDKTISPSITVFNNSLGGRVAVIASFLPNNQSSAILQLRMQLFFHKLFTYLNGEEFDASITDRPDIWCLANRSADSRRLLVTLTNLSDDKQDGLCLHVAPCWNGKKVSELNADGQFVPLPVKAKNGILNLGTMEIHENRVLSIEK